MNFRTLATMTGLILASGSHATLLKPDLLRIEPDQSRAAPKCATGTMTPSGTHCYLPAVITTKPRPSTSATPGFNLAPTIANTLIAKSSFDELGVSIETDRLRIELDQSKAAPKCAEGTMTPSGTHCYLPAVITPKTNSSRSTTSEFYLTPNLSNALTLQRSFGDVGPLPRANDALLREPVTSAAVAVSEPTTWSLMAILTFGFLLRALKKDLAA